MGGIHLEVVPYAIWMPACAGMTTSVGPVMPTRPRLPQYHEREDVLPAKAGIQCSERVWRPSPNAKKDVAIWYGTPFCSGTLRCRRLVSPNQQLSRERLAGDLGCRAARRRHLAKWANKLVMCMTPSRPPSSCPFPVQTATRERFTRRHTPPIVISQLAPLHPHKALPTASRDWDCRHPNPSSHPCRRPSPRFRPISPAGRAGPVA